ncbi:MAG: prepilin-type N-terminal cleavage/methylation domain-containing protein [Candidatus Paceibacterota bacterium]|jgi:prepilin-type N-terminal cleavage/methylation domain-containing protein
MNYKKGFTLIELLMVISIITLLSSVILSYVGSARAKTRDSVRLSDMKQIGTAANLYYEDKGVLPGSIGILVSSGYLSALPSDPSGKSYNSYLSGDSKSFVAYTSYETQFIESSTTAQQVGIVTGNAGMEELCEIAVLLNQPFPNCKPGGDSNDQIVGLTSGHRRGGSSGSGIVEPPPVVVSDCAYENINNSCPTEDLLYLGCYCGGGVYDSGLVWSLSEKGPVYLNENGLEKWQIVSNDCSSWHFGGRLPSKEEMVSGIGHDFKNLNSYLTNEDGGGVIFWYVFVDWNYNKVPNIDYFDNTQTLYNYYCVYNL